MENEKVETLKKLIDGFDTKYYDKENENLIREINNIRMGRPRHEGISDKYRKDIVPKSQVEKEILKLEKERKDNTERAKELGRALSQLRMSASKLETLVEQEILLSQLKKLVSGRSHLEMGKTDIYEENKDKYKKLYLKSNKKVRQSKRKISKEIYKLINKNRPYKAYKSKYSIATALKNNNISIKDKYDPENKFYSDARKEYRDFPYFDDISRLGVDVSALDSARKKIKGELDSDSLTWHGKGAFDKLKNIERAQKTNIETKGGYSKLIEIKEKYTEIVELSRETWYVDEILNAFRDTDITKTEMYKGLQELVREQEKELYKLTSEVDKLYEKTGLQNKIDLIEQLEELYNKTEELKSQIEKFKNSGNYRQAEILEQDYYNLRYEMIKILKDNPDLNRPGYNIDIKSIIKKEKELYEPEIKKEIKGTEKTNTTLVEEVVEQKIDSQVTAPEKIEVKKETVKESDNLAEGFELEPNLQVFRTMHYQNYMKEKVLESDLGKLSFSDYLQTVAPNLTKLINIEKERESVARTIYREYIRYYSSLEDKQLAMSFEEYSVRNHDLSNIDVPIEHEEEYKGMMRR